VFFQVPDLHINEIWLTIPNCVIRHDKLICLLRKVKQSCVLYGDNLAARAEYCSRWCYNQEQLNFVEYLQMQVEKYLGRCNTNIIIGQRKTGRIGRMYNTIIESGQPYPKQNIKTWEKNPSEQNPWKKQSKDNPQQNRNDFSKCPIKYSDDYKNKFYKSINRLRQSGLILPNDKVEITEHFDLKKWDDPCAMAGAMQQHYGSDIIRKLTKFIKNNKMDELIDASWIFCQLERFKNNSK
jgi:hypothetical protein